MAREIEVKVFDRGVLVQRTACTLHQLPNGAMGVLWRGVPYPLLDEDRIDVSQAADVPLPSSDQARPPYAVIEGDGASWVLVRGLPTAVGDLKARLEGSGITVLRAGRWLGEPVRDIAYDWFLRCDGLLGEDIDRLLGVAGRPTEQDASTRLAVIEQHVLELRSELCRLEDSLRAAMPRQPEAPQSVAAVDVDQKEQALQDALAQVAQLQARLDAEPNPSASLPRAAMRLHEELASAFVALRPDIVPLRDTLQVAVGEYASRSGFYRCIEELPPSGGRPLGWKALRGVERWWERHVTTGQDDSGRAYVRFDEVTRRWHLLLSWKAEQKRDIEWLRRQG